MAILSLSNAHLAYGHVALLDGAGLSFESGERLALIGRNGTGKSSLLRVLAGTERLDDGLLQQQQGLRVIYVPQEPELDATFTTWLDSNMGFAPESAGLEMPNSDSIPITRRTDITSFKRMD